MTRNLTTAEQAAVSQSQRLLKALQRAEIGLQRQYSNASLARAIESAIDTENTRSAEALALKAEVLLMRAEAIAQMRGAEMLTRMLAARWEENKQVMDGLR